ncbi:Hypothetical protein GbCGDNIH4_7260 [Granulibacter bethesdensis CGDNIH4]|nr:Hypothetical protein GbCGDNIH4_7260 [Granulibacter bethesdensis CGDNIH4]
MIYKELGILSVYFLLLHRHPFKRPQHAIHPWIAPVFSQRIGETGEGAGHGQGLAGVDIGDVGGDENRRAGLTIFVGPCAGIETAMDLQRCDLRITLMIEPVKFCLHTGGVAGHRETSVKRSGTCRAV